MANTTIDVLIVEDEPSIADTIIYTLESENISCQCENTGRAAIDWIKNTSPSLVLLDVGLPDMSGFDVCRELRTFTDIPILFLTSRNSEIDQVVGLELGADDYITKPFSPRVLSAKLRAKLRRSAKEDEVKPVSHGFKNNSSDQSIVFDGEKMDLSRYEYRLLSLMISHPSRLYSRDELMELVWEEPENSFDRTVDTHIKVLRKKIKLIREGYDPIKTRRGLGYQFEL